MKRGDVYVADLAPRSGSEQQGRRPVIVLSHDAFNQAPKWRSIIVVPISTSATQAKRGLTAVRQIIWNLQPQKAHLIITISEDISLDLHEDCAN